jgi:hypothetical protein
MVRDGVHARKKTWKECGEMKCRRFVGVFLSAGATSVFNIGCAGFGRSRAMRIADGAKIRLEHLGLNIWGWNIWGHTLQEDVISQK